MFLTGALTLQGVRGEILHKAKLCGNVRRLAKTWGFSHTFLYEVLSGKRQPSPRLLRAMGLRKEIMYVSEKRS
jgi:hypothetical protein